MRCDGCGATGWLKTVECRDDRDRRGTLCDACYGPLARLLWIVAGPLTVTAQCSGCGLYLNPAELAVRRGLARERHVGICVSCFGTRHPRRG